MPYINVCYHCKREFEVQRKPQHEPKNDRKFVKYCSKECRSVVQSQNTTLRNRQREKRRPLAYVNVCLVCKREFEVFDKRKNNPENKSHFKKCCSDKCVSKMRSDTAKKNAEKGIFENNGNFQKERWLQIAEERAGMTINEAVDLYVVNRMSINEIAEKYGFSRSRMSMELDNRGIEKDNHYREIQNRIDLAVAEYVNNPNITITELEDKYKVTRLTISKHLKKNKIDIRDPLQKYQYNGDYFEFIDTEEKAYWLGFLGADGCINESSTYKSVELGLKAEDKEHIEKFVAAIGGEPDMIKERTTRFDSKYFLSNRVTVSCTKMANDLIEKGVTPRKSFTLQFPTFLSSNLLGPYMRGYFDGDGNVNLRKNAITISIVGNDMFIKGYINKLNEILGIQLPKIYKKQKSECRTVYYYGQNARRILDFFYGDATVFLTRKKKKYVNGLRQVKEDKQQQLELFPL
ncbi:MULTISPECIES: LAGLIDADG family homing endonuclease [Bacillus cereus group]|uniref:LAGLIDADG family homing endonuclease n=1 Tax=Bacillus cereus group TaxID=86661 RepID=UPI0008FDF236|nr:MULTISPECIES: LAGLIDADG family homing endonuclease [Bacillus cereus group]MDG1620321.1 LAGLIDADG family homing endonuclease [Bacillus mobilis]MDX5838460.1 LAGLIDADG family homing endonuclease [Bacillus cereus group sp. BfR-BA-01700]OJE47493.1 hypothetical protein BAQ44_26150 [Bacillus mobilis]HDR7241623.1 LAGLIDADG family homing endonuclease [Bacillus mobilis]